MIEPPLVHGDDVEVHAAPVLRSRVAHAEALRAFGADALAAWCRTVLVFLLRADADLAVRTPASEREKERLCDEVRACARCRAVHCSAVQCSALRARDADAVCAQFLRVCRAVRSAGWALEAIDPASGLPVFAEVLHAPSAHHDDVGVATDVVRGMQTQPCGGCMVAGTARWRTHVYIAVAYCDVVCDDDEARARLRTLLLQHGVGATARAHAATT